MVLGRHQNHTSYPIVLFGIENRCGEQVVYPAASSPSLSPPPPRSRSKNNGTEHDGGMHKDEKQALKMKPRAAGVPSKFSSADFVGCCYDENGVCYVVTSTGTLCSVDSNKMMVAHMVVVQATMPTRAISIKTVVLIHIHPPIISVAIHPPIFSDLTQPKT